MNKLLLLFLFMPISVSAGLDYKRMEVELALLRASYETHVPFNILKAVCKVESNLNPLAHKEHDGNSASTGLCQIKSVTAREVGFKGNYPKDLKEPYLNAYYSGKYLRKNYKKYGTWAMAIIAYNHGHYEPKLKHCKYLFEKVAKYL